MEWLENTDKIVQVIVSFAVGIPAVYSVLGKTGKAGKIAWSWWRTIKDGRASDEEVAYHVWQLVAVLGGWSPRAGSKLLRFAPDAQIKELKNSGFLPADYVVKKK